MLSIGRSGLQAWLLQRISAVVLLLYFLGLFVFWAYVGDSHPLQWQWLFSYTWIRYATVLVLFSLLAHAWIGFWIISTDYIKHTWLRVPIQTLVYIWLLFSLIDGIQILWG